MHTCTNYVSGKFKNYFIISRCIYCPSDSLAHHFSGYFHPPPFLSHNAYSTHRNFHFYNNILLNFLVINKIQNIVTFSNS